MIDFFQRIGQRHLESGLIDPVVARQAFPLAESGEVFRRLLGGSSDGFLKAIVSPAHG